MKVGYEEKTYESYFNTELAQRSVYFPPGQAFEGHLGFDSASLSRNRSLWRRVGYPFWFWPPFDGIELSHVASDIEQYFGESVNSIPKFRANLLFQYKRPEYMVLRTSTEWSLWNKEYFRYDLDSEQHQRLMYIEGKFGKKVLILYSSPAIDNLDDLVQSYKDSKIIERSNFKKVAELSSHRRNTYVQAGTFSIACSKPKRIRNFDLIKEIDLFAEQVSDAQDQRTNKQFIIDFGKGIEAALVEDEPLAKLFKVLTTEAERYKHYPLIYSLSVMEIFRSLTGIQWAIKY